MLPSITAFLALLIFGSICWFGGWFYRSLREQKIRTQNTPDSEHLKYQFNKEHSDETIEDFIKMLEVNPNTFELHLALGNLFRQQGHTERAIRIHQNISERPNIEKSQKRTALFQLAQDYHCAGLLDRAEQSYIELIAQRAFLKESLTALLCIYQKEKEWIQAIKVGEQLLKLEQHNTELKNRIAHYHCEEATIHLKKQKFTSADEHIKHALQTKSTSVRPDFLSAQCYLQQQKIRACLKVLFEIPSKDLRFMSATIQFLHQCFPNANDQIQKGKQLKKLINTYPASPISAAITKQITGTTKKNTNGYGLRHLLEVRLSQLSEQTKKEIDSVCQVFNSLDTQQNTYLCEKCGYTGHALHWLCPSCETWDTVKPQ